MRLDLPVQLDHGEVAQGELVALLTIPLDWREVLSFDFRFQDHINLLEARALMTLVQRLCRTHTHSKRIIILPADR